MFALAGIFVVAMALLTMSFQTISGSGQPCEEFKDGVKGPSN
jgi:hypothetical protein